MFYFENKGGSGHGYWSILKINELENETGMELENWSMKKKIRDLANSETELSKNVD